MSSFKCKYCDRDVKLAPGMMVLDDENDIVHEECFQMSGDDGGFVEQLYKELEEDE